MISVGAAGALIGCVGVVDRVLTAVVTGDRSFGRAVVATVGLAAEPQLTMAIAIVAAAATAVKALARRVHSAKAPPRCDC